MSNFGQARRNVIRGDVEINVNSKAMNQDRFVDQSRLQRWYCEEYVPSDTPGKTGKFVGRTEVASVGDRARLGANAMKHRSSFTDECDTRGGDDCCSYPTFYGGRGPLTTKRGD
jgi:hypothetical protein